MAKTNFRFPPKCAALPPRRQYLTREEFAARHAGQRTLRLSGTVKAMQAAFDMTREPITFSSDKNFYSAGPGWDACTGWGSPKGMELLKALGE